MAKTVNILNGTGAERLINGVYTVTADVTGYDNSTINPSSITVDQTTNTYAFSISATGTLTLHVTEDGTSSGTAVVGATFVRCDSTGTEYGTPVVSDSNGDCVFNNVPYAASNAPVIYYKQTASDGEHEFDNTLKNITMTTSEDTVEIENILGAERTINLFDANYQNLPIESGSLTFTN